MYSNFTFQLHPIAFAVFNDDPLTLSYLLSIKQGAALLNEPCVCVEHNTTNCDWTTKQILESGDSFMITSLMIASMKQKPLLMKILLYHGADKSSRTKQGKTARDFWPRDLNKVPIALKEEIKEDSEKYKLILGKFVHPKTKKMEDLTTHKNQSRLEKLLIAEKLKAKHNLEMVDYEAYQLFKADKLSDEDSERCSSIQLQSETGTNQNAMITAIDLYVRQLIQNDSNFAMNVLIQKIDLETFFDPYLMNLRGERADWHNSFIRLCVRYQAIKLLNDVLQHCPKNKLKEIIQLETKDRKQSPLFSATSMEMCQILYDLGFDIQTKSFDPERGLIYHHAKAKHYKVVRWLIFNGCVLRKGATNDNVLIEACVNGVCHCLPVLIPLCDIEALKANEHSLLYYAVESCNITTIRMLMKNGFDDINSSVNISNGQNALHHACRDTEKDAKGAYSKKHPAVVLVYHLLFNVNCDVSAVDANGDTALHIAVKSDMYRVKLILSKLCQYPDHGEAVINCKNHTGLTSLQVALADIKSNNLRILLKTNKCKLDGTLAYCVEKGHGADRRPPLFDLLVKYGAVLDAKEEETVLEKMSAVKNWQASRAYYIEFQKARDENMKGIVYDTYETFSIWSGAESKQEDENKYNDDVNEEGKIEFETDSELIRDYRDITEVDELKCADDSNARVVDLELGIDKNKEILDLCLAMMDNNDTSQFAESYFSDIIMHYMFDRKWEILNTICAASQYEPILLKAYTHAVFQSNINRIICAHKNVQSAQLIVESLTFSFGNRYIDIKDVYSKKKATNDDKKEEEEEAEMIIKSVTMIQSEESAKALEERNEILRECVEFIMKETIYEKLQMTNNKTLDKKLLNYVWNGELQKDIEQDVEEEEEVVVEGTEVIETKEEEIEITKPLGIKPNFEKYDKMRKIGLTDVGIRQKMILNRMEKYWIKYYFGELETQTDVEKETGNEDKKELTDKTSKISEKEYEKYSKMIKCGIHPKHVANAMKKKGYDEQSINSICN